MFWDWDFFDDIEFEDLGWIGGVFGLVEEEMEEEKRPDQENDPFTDDEYDD
jgi:hypothetical protein